MNAPTDNAPAAAQDASIDDMQVWWQVQRFLHYEADLLDHREFDAWLELLDEDEALELLRHGEVGRVGVTIGALPAIFPVNYRLLDGAIVFRTAPGTKLAAATVGAGEWPAIAPVSPRAKST